MVIDMTVQVQTKDKFYFENEFKKVDFNSLVIGFNSVLRELRKGTIGKLYLASNIPEDKEKELLYFAELNNVEVLKSELNSKYLGPLVKKTFNVLVVGKKK